MAHVKRPNILFLMSDEHRADVGGYEGNTVVRTPVLDELARTGVVFRNAYTPSPLCIPARQCLAASGWINGTISQFSEKCLMIKRDHLKYQYLYYYDTEYPELLYDLQRNPDESINLLNDPQYADEVAAFRSRASELGHGPNPKPHYLDAGYHTGRRSHLACSHSFYF